MESTSQPDIDPQWYPGQIETCTSRDLSTSAPTVLSKLGKWGQYESMGTPVLPTKFIPMKTPLSKSIVESWTDRPPFILTVPHLLETQKAEGRKIGLILDLSNHECLYSDDLDLNDLRYSQISLVAKELPPSEYVDSVCLAAQEFWRAHPDEYIAIHCAYGFNRTGFVVCCFLIEYCNLSVDEALAAFGSARPPGVRHRDFREELYRRYQPQGAKILDLPNDAMTTPRLGACERASVAFAASTSDRSPIGRSISANVVCSSKSGSVSCDLAHLSPCHRSNSNSESCDLSRLSPCNENLMTSKPSPHRSVLCSVKKDNHSY
jgi:hypothetical protein